MTAGLLVYLVEDDAGMRDAVSLLLRGAGFEVHSYTPLSAEPETSRAR
jgi:FixJ family two-component response regulator